MTSRGSDQLHANRLANLAPARCRPRPRSTTVLRPSGPGGSELRCLPGAYEEGGASSVGRPEPV